MFHKNSGKNVSNKNTIPVVIIALSVLVTLMSVIVIVCSAIAMTDTSTQEEKVEYDGDEPFYGAWYTAYQDKDEAIDIANALRRDELDAYVVTTSDWSDLNDETWYAVTIGISETEDAAAAQAQGAEEQGYTGIYMKYSGEHK